MDTIDGILKGLNNEEKLVFDLIQKKGPISKSELILITGIKLSTLNRLMEPLENAKLILEIGTGESSGGRKPALYDVSRVTGYVIGIDISRTYTQVIVSNLKAEILCKVQFPMDESCTPEITFTKTAEAVKSCMLSIGISLNECIGAGIGTVGPLDREKGVILCPENFPAPGWKDVPVKELLQKELGLPVFIDNGANAAALAEYLFGDGSNFKSLAYFNCGIGIRTGVISSGVIVRTVNSTEDAFAHIVIDVDGESCSCGNYGCIECYCSIHSILKKFRAEVKKGRYSVITKPVEEISYIDICKAAEGNDSLSREVLAGAAMIFAAGLANYINMLNPGMVVLSGPLVTNSNFFYDVCQEVAVKKIYMKESNRTVFSKGGFFGDNAIAIGAAAMVVEYYLGSRVLE